MRLRWRGHVRRMKDGRIPKDTLYRELATHIRPTGRPFSSDVCKRDMKTDSINPQGIQPVDRNSWRTAARTCIRSAPVRDGDGNSGRRKRNVRSRRQKQTLGQVRRPSNTATVTESVAQGSDCTVTAGSAATRTDTLWVHKPLK